MSLGKMQVEFHPPHDAGSNHPLREARETRFKLRRMAAKALQGTDCDRVASCGHKLVGQQATVCVGQGGAYVAGTETCGSVWACPVCAGKVAEGRRVEIAQCLSNHTAGVGAHGPQLPGEVYMVALTIPHHHAESCYTLRHIVSGAWKKLIQGKAWETARERWAVAGYIRALEVTRGKNGWHPHLHVLFLTGALSDGDAEEFKFWLIDRWARIVERISGKQVHRDVGVDFRKSTNNDTAGDYVAKWGADSEVAKAAVKVSKKGGRSPFQLLADALEGDHYSRVLFREYAVAFKGARQLTWSRGLRALYTCAEELSDADLARQDAPHNGDAQIIAFRRGVWIRIVTAGLVPEVLAAAEDAGKSGVLKLLRAHGLALPEEILFGRQPDDPETAAR